MERLSTILLSSKTFALDPSTPRYRKHISGYQIVSKVVFCLCCVPENRPTLLRAAVRSLWVCVEEKKILWENGGSISTHLCPAEWITGAARCSTLDENPRQRCQPVNCVFKYDGLKNYFDRKDRVCKATKKCYSDPTSALPSQVCSSYRRVAVFLA